jgi:hypothetical protein
MNVGGQIEPGVDFVEVLNAQVAADKGLWKLLPYF